MPDFDECDDTDPIRAFVQHSPIPADARRMGFDANTEEGAMIAMAGSLSSAKLSHKLIAWVLLVGFTGPWLLGIVYEIF
jgi:hypothetical protein